MVVEVAVLTAASMVAREAGWMAAVGPAAVVQEAVGLEVLMVAEWVVR